jgi:hypothetical protein
VHIHDFKAPLPGSYVVFLPVIAGPYPGGADEREARRRIRRVTAEGCDFFLDLTEDGELEPYAHLLPGRVRHMRLALRKSEVPPPARMREVLDALNRASARDGYVVYVHDAEGTGRVGMAVACWIADLQVVDAGVDVLDFLERLRAEIPGRGPAPETAEQRAFARGWTRGQAPRGLMRARVPGAAQTVVEGGMR